MKDELTPELEQALNEYGIARRAMPPRNADRVWAAFSNHFDTKKSGGYSARALRRWVSQLKGADAGRGKSGFGVGNHQLKSWSRYAIGVGALTAAIIISIVGIKYIPTKTSPIQFKTYSTTSGQRAKIQLPDGSTVTLAPASTIRYAESFGKEIRTVELTGLAVFTVIHEGRPPFIVRSGGAEARVLGTTFSVRRYQEDTITRVVVAEGKVQIARSVLTSGEAVSITNNGISSIDRDANVSTELGWVTGRLNFRSVPLNNVISEVNRMYGMDIRLDNPALGARSITASIDGGLSPRGIASLLSGISGTRAEWHGSVVLFRE